MRNPADYAAALRDLSDADLAAELRHVASGCAREAKGTRERAWWDELRRYVWSEWRRRCEAAGRACKDGYGYLPGGQGWHEQELAGWSVGVRLRQLCDSPIREV